MMTSLLLWLQKKRARGRGPCGCRLVHKIHKMSKACMKINMVHEGMLAMAQESMLVIAQAIMLLESMLAMLGHSQ